MGDERFGEKVDVLWKKHIPPEEFDSKKSYHLACLHESLEVFELLQDKLSNYSGDARNVQGVVDDVRAAYSFIPRLAPEDMVAYANWLHSSTRLDVEEELGLPIEDAADGLRKLNSVLGSLGNASEENSDLSSKITDLEGSIKKGFIRLENEVLRVLRQSSTPSEFKDIRGELERIFDLYINR